MTIGSSAIGLSAIAYALPDACVALEALDARGLLPSGAATLRGLGFEQAHVSEAPADALAAAAIARLFAAHDVAPESIDALFYAGAIPSSHMASGSGGFGFLDAFSYPGPKLQYEFGLLNAAVTGVSQSGCVGLMRAIDLAGDFLRARPEASRALAVSADVLPEGAPREILYSVISDGGCAVLVERGAARNRIVASRHLTKGYYFDPTERKAEIIAAYFPTARAIVRETLTAAGLSPADVDWIMPQNVSLRSWEILRDLLALPRARLFDANIRSKGHVIAADNLINLHDAEAGGCLRSGERLLLFNFGFGANWSCLVLEH